MDKITEAISAIETGREYSFKVDDVDSIVWRDSKPPISKEDIQAKITELENLKITKKASGKQKLKDLGLDDDGNKIPNSDRMQYKYIKIIKEGATMPSEADVNAKIQDLKDADTAKENKKASGKQKLKDLGLDDDEIKALMGA